MRPIKINTKTESQTPVRAVLLQLHTAYRARSPEEENENDQTLMHPSDYQCSEGVSPLSPVAGASFQFQGKRRASNREQPTTEPAAQQDHDQSEHH